MRTYRYTIDQCDVGDKESLTEFRECRLTWLSWLSGDDVHAIWRQISSALWNDVAFRTLGAMADGCPSSALNNHLLIETIFQGYYSTQVLIIRRLLDKRNDVVSLRRLLTDIETHRHAFTRENYVCHDGLPFDYEGVRHQNMLDRLRTSGSGPYWGEADGPKADWASERWHAAFDKISESRGASRSRTEGMSPKIIAGLCKWLDESGADALVTWSHKMLAHAADSASRRKVQLAEIGPDLEKIAKVHRAFVLIGQILGAYVLADSGHGVTVPVPQFDQFAKLNHAAVESERIPAVRSLWDDLSKERDGWLKDTDEALADVLAAT